MTYNYEVNCPRYRLNFKATSIQFFFSVSICFKKKKKKKRKKKKTKLKKTKQDRKLKNPYGRDIRVSNWKPVNENLFSRYASFNAIPRLITS